MTDEAERPADLDATRLGHDSASGLATMTHTMASMPPRGANEMPVVAGYELIRVLGRGGMGVVWEAIEHRLDRKVALKVHLDEVSPDRVAQMWSEARLAARVADPGVVAVHDLGTTVDGSPYYTMDLVVGTDLRALLREGALRQDKALRIASQIAHAVAAAHDRGIVHRDLKPANVLIDEEGRPRILDFGLAFSSGVGKDLFEKLVFGTPAYMSPEQVSAGAVGAAADIHAIGILLYEMLTGARPFAGGGPNEIMKAVLERIPEPPTAKNPAIHDDVERVVLRCLEKKPEDRFPSARALVAALEAIREGRPLEPSLRSPPLAARRPLAPTPRLSPIYARESAPVHHRWSWSLASSPADLWPLVANTERLNKAIGLPEVDFSDSPDGDGASVRLGRFHVLGMDVVWREYPFEWVKEREHSVYRAYDKGPLSALWNRVQLRPAPGGGTELIHEVWLVPRNLVGRVAASWEVGQKTAKNLDRVYRSLDQALQHPSHTPHADAFEPPHAPTGAQRQHVEEGRARLAERGFEASLVERLCGHLLYEPTKLLERVRPYALADAWGTDRAETLTLFLYAANAGLVDIAWDLVCPRCLTAHESSEGLGRVARAASCVPCSTSYNRDLRESVELVFRPHPEVRNANATTYCTGAPALRPHVLVQQSLTSGERRSLSVDLPRGDYRITASRVPHGFVFAASPAGFLGQSEVVIEGDVVVARPSVVRAGEVSFTVVNATDKDQIVRIEIPGARKDGVSAADVMTLPDFRDLFSSELLADGEHMSVSRMAFLFVDLVDRSGVLSRHGDAGTWGILQEIEDLLTEQLRAHRGVPVPASLDTYVAAFNTSAAAVRAAIALQRGARELREPVRAAVHEGQCIALTRALRTEYFGKTLHRGVALLDEAPPAGIALSVAVAGERAVAEVLEDAGITRNVVAATEGAYRGTRVTRITMR